MTHLNLSGIDFEAEMTIMILKAMVKNLTLQEINIDIRQGDERNVLIELDTDSLVNMHTDGDQQAPLHRYNRYRLSSQYQWNIH